MNGNFKWQWGLIPDPYRVTESRYFKSVSPEALSSALFAESQTDIACYHSLPMQGIFGDFSPISVGLAIRERYPHRMLLYGAASPLDGPEVLEDLEQQVAEWGISGVKLYPLDLVDGELRSYSIADHETVYPLLEKCRDLGSGSSRSTRRCRSALLRLTRSASATSTTPRVTSPTSPSRSSTEASRFSTRPRCRWRASQTSTSTSK